MAELLNLAVAGCGDFLRWQQPSLAASHRVRARWFWDPDARRAEAWAGRMGGTRATSFEELLENRDVHVVALFGPPFVRAEQIQRCAEAGKAVLTTKPLAPSIAECAQCSVDDKIPIGVLYGRSDDPAIEALRDLFVSDSVGKLALYKRDWSHHYPEWNDWALDPERNGGPFMDAMIHNLNSARTLIGRPTTRFTFFSDRFAHPELGCADTQAMKLDFEGPASAYLFITWAADLAVHSRDGNHREHIDHHFMVTDRGYRITLEQGSIIASRHGERQTFEVPAFQHTIYDEFAEHVADGRPLPRRLATAREAGEDIELIRRGMAAPGQCQSTLGAPQKVGS